MVSSAEKRRAREAVKRAVKSGRLPKPERCEDCGSDVGPEAHHPDYTRPLNVVWVCDECHAVRHDETGDMDRTHFEFAFRGTDAVALRYEDEAAYYDWRNWPPN